MRKVFTFLGFIGAAAFIGHMSQSPAPNPAPVVTTSPAAPVPVGITVSGTLSLSTLDSNGEANTANTSDRYTAGAPTCSGIGGYSDISGGVQVVITDDMGKTLKITSLDAGMDNGSTCDFLFSATVPAGSSTYGVTISHRGTLQYSQADLGTITMTLGTG